MKDWRITNKKYRAKCVKKNSGSGSIVEAFNRQDIARPSAQLEMLLIIQKVLLTS